MGSSQTIKQHVPKVLFGILLSVVFSYSVFVTRYIWQSKDLTMETKIENNLMTVSGHATKATEAEINGHIVALDNHGNFIDKISLLPGYNTITVITRDSFGKNKTMLEQVYHEQNSPTVAQASKLVVE